MPQDFAEFGFFSPQGDGADVAKVYTAVGYNTNTYKKPEPLTYIRFELLLPTTEG